MRERIAAGQKCYGEKSSSAVINSAREHRIKEVDAFKGFLIFAVVFGHFLLPLKDSPYSFFGRSFYLIYSFHMPAFLFLSGYFRQKSKRKKGAKLRSLLSFTLLSEIARKEKKGRHVKTVYQIKASSKKGIGTVLQGKQKMSENHSKNQKSLKSIHFFDSMLSCRIDYGRRAFFPVTFLSCRYPLTQNASFIFFPSRIFVQHSSSQNPLHRPLETKTRLSGKSVQQPLQAFSFLPWLLLYSFRR